MVASVLFGATASKVVERKAEERVRLEAQRIAAEEAAKQADMYRGHKGEGANILFVDTHVKWYRKTGTFIPPLQTPRVSFWRRFFTWLRRN